MSELPAFKDLVFYEIYPNSFYDANGDGFGDLKGIEEKLPYIKGLGFNAIWLNPIYDSPFLDGGYDVRDPFKVSPRFGTNEELKGLIEKMHSLGMRLFLDLVPGHMSWENKDFLESGKGVRNDKYDLFIWNENPWDLTPGYRMVSGLYDRHACYMVNFFVHQPAINYGFNKITEPKWQIPYKEAKGKDYLEKIMKFWLDYGVDGFRVDMADSLVKNDDEKVATIELWQTILKDLKKDGYNDFYMTSEWSNPWRSLKAGFSSDFVLDHWDNFSHMLFRSHDDAPAPLLHKYDEKRYQECLKDILDRVKAYKTLGGRLSIISGNHDTWRIANYLNDEELRLAYLFLFTMPGVPYLYFGDELGAHTNLKLPSFEGGYQRTGSRTPMRWDSSKNAGFSKADHTFLPTIEGDPTVEEEEKNPDSLLHEVKKLVALRNQEEDLRSDDFEYLNEALAYSRGKIRVYINLKDTDLKVDPKGQKIIHQLGDVKKEGGKLLLKRHAAIVLK